MNWIKSLSDKVMTTLPRAKYLAVSCVAALCLCLWMLGSSLNSNPVKLFPNIPTPKSIPTINPRVELEDLHGKKQDDPILIRYLQQYHIYPPSTRTYRYSELDEGRLFYIRESRQVMKIIQTYLKNLTNGVFVEAGANNGANELSNTLVLERDYNWTGLLVEGSPVIFPRLVAAHRKSWKSDLLLSQHPQTKLVDFHQTPRSSIYAGRESNFGDDKESKNPPVDVVAKDGITPLFHFEVLSVPLYSLVAACNIQTIDYLSLDVEGSELEILRNFPYDKVPIRTMVVEVNVMGEKKTMELIDFLETKGYFKHTVRANTRDLIFVHKSVIVDQKA